MSLHMLGFPIRTFPDQSLMTAPRDLSQSSTSFIGNIRLGIHFVPLSTFLCIDSTSNWNEPTALVHMTNEFAMRLVMDESITRRQSIN